MVSYIQSIDTRHEDMIHDAQMDFYGIKLATCSSDRSIKIFDVKSSQQTLQQELIGHEGPVWQLSWAHPKFGSILASCSYDKKVIIWKEVNGKWCKIYEYTGHESSVNSVSWGPYEYGLQLACGSSDNKISILSSEDGVEWKVAVISNAHNSGVNAVSWAPSTTPTSYVDTSPDTALVWIRKIVSGGCDGLIKIWNYSEDDDQWTEEVKLEGHGDWVRDVAWAPLCGLAKSQIASCSQDGRVIIWNNDGASETWYPKELQKFDDVIWHTSWSPTGSILAVSGGDNKVTLWKESMDGSWQCISNVNKGQEMKS